jgi:hypothetical protein
MCIQSPGWPAGYHFSSINAQPPHDQDAPYTGSWDFSACSKTITSCEEVQACADQVFTPPTETCDQLGEAYCEDDARVYCNPEGLLYKAPPCALQSNFECSPLQPLNVDDYFIGCVPPGCGGIRGAGAEEACDGDDYTFEDGYLSLRLHCPDYGFRTCLEGRCAG